MMNKIVLEAAAKLNLSLDITGLREDGYHLLDSVMQSVNLYDRVALNRRDKGILLDAPGSGVPGGAENTAYRAADAFFEETGIAGGVEILLAKRIPTQAGMGGGSADAAAVLVGLNRMYETGLSEAQLQQIGLRVGADVPFCVVGGSARVQGIGEVIWPADTLHGARFVVVKPCGKGVDTKEAYRRYDEMGARSRPDTERLLQAAAEEDIPGFASCMYNVLEESASLPEIPKLKQELLSNGALAAMMTGSGAAVFGVFQSLILSMTVRGRFASRYHAYLLEPVSKGVRVIGEE